MNAVAVTDDGMTLGDDRRWYDPKEWEALETNHEHADEFLMSFVHADTDRCCECNSRDHICNECPDLIGGAQ